MHAHDTPALCELSASPEPLRGGADGGLDGRGGSYSAGRTARPWLLDLFCGAGGAAMGYHRAGFGVVGVDVEPQPRYPFAFVQADALEFLDEGGAAGFASVHASPPCQAYSGIRPLCGGKEYPDLVGPTRERLLEWGGVYVIENVPGAPLIHPTLLCGSSLGLYVRRHRLFESNVSLLAPPCVHNANPKQFKVPLGDLRRYRMVTDPRHAGDTAYLSRFVAVYGSTRYRGEDADRRRAMGIEWMRRRELTQAIPPVYTELIGAQLLQVIA